MSGIKQSSTASELFSDYLQRNNKRRTGERFAILEHVGRIAGHFTAESLFKTMCDDGYHVSQGTVYSTLELLVECGLVIRHRFSGNANLYERAIGNTPTHHHLICTVCGKIKEIKDTDINAIIASKRFPAFTQTSFALNIYGICNACARRHRRTTGNK